ncbi:hypothetical protein CON05_05110 [Bacillus cereus]|nr:hypothetical protein CON05_05110 [Bacillus cereus]
MTNEVLILLFISSITNSEQKMMKTSRGLVCPFVDTFFRNDHVKKSFIYVRLLHARATFILSSETREVFL